MTQWSNSSARLPTKIKYTKTGQAKITIPSPIIEMFSILKADENDKLKPSEIIFTKDTVNKRVWVDFRRSS